MIIFAIMQYLQSCNIFKIHYLIYPDATRAVLHYGVL